MPVPNLIEAYKETFDSGWTKDNIYVDDNAAVAPNGTTTAARIRFWSGSSARRLRFQDNLGILDKSFSIFLKAGEISVCHIFLCFNNFNDTVYVDFNLSTGQVVGVNPAGPPYYVNGATSSFNAENYGDGWWRLSFGKNASDGQFGIGLGSYGQSLAWGNNNAKMYVWGAKWYTDGPAIGADEYVAANGWMSAYSSVANTPDAFGDTSENFTPLVYNGAIITPNAAIAPDGTNTASRIYSANQGQGLYGNYTDGARYNDMMLFGQFSRLGMNFSMSAFFKADTSNDVYLSGWWVSRGVTLRFNLVTKVWTNILTSVWPFFFPIWRDYGNGWIRIGMVGGGRLPVTSSDMIVYMQQRSITTPTPGAVFMWGYHCGFTNEIALTPYTARTNFPTGWRSNADKVVFSQSFRMLGR